MIIFKGKRLRCEWLQHCPENVTVQVLVNSRINADLFLEWGQLFVQSLPQDDARPILLLIWQAAQKLLKSEFFSVFCPACRKAATVENAQAGFRGTGMFPLNKHILQESALAPSKTTERPLPLTSPSPFSKPPDITSTTRQNSDNTSHCPADPRIHQPHSSPCSGIRGAPNLYILGCRGGRIWRNNSQLWMCSWGRDGL